MRSLMMRLKMSDQVSSPATWMPARVAARPARRGRRVAVRQRRHQVDAGVALERVGDREPFGRGAGIARFDP